MKFLENLIIIFLILTCVISFVISFSFGFYVSKDKSIKQPPQERQNTTSIQVQSYPLYTAKCTKSNSNFCEEYSVFRVFTQN